MDDKLKKDMLAEAAADGFELDDETLDSIAGGYVFHDKGDAAAHRKEAFYVLDAKGDVILRLDDMKEFYSD